MGQVILVSSRKKEIGKTIVAIKTCLEFSKRNNNVLLIDLSSGLVKASEYLKVNEDIIYDVKDVLDKTCSIDQAIIDISENFKLLPYPRMVNKLGEIKLNDFSSMINEAKIIYDVIIVDLDSFNFSYFVENKTVNSLITINNNDFSCINEINNDILLAEMLGITNVLPIINMYNKNLAKKGNMLNINELKKLLNKDVFKLDVFKIDEDIKFKNLDEPSIINEDNFDKTIENLVNELNH